MKYLAFKLSIIFLAPLPINVGYFISDRISDVLFLVSRGVRRKLERNLKQVMGEDVPKAKLNRTSREAFHTLGRNYFDLIRLPRLKLDKLSQNLTLNNVHHFEEAYSKKKGVIIATAHMGNFDLVVQVLAARTQKLTVPVEPLQPERLFRLVTGLRASKGLSFVPMSVAGLRTTVRALKQGEIVAIACDRDIAGNGIRMNFMGAEARFPTGAIELALKTGAIIVPAFSVRMPHNQFSICLEPPLVLKTGGEHDQAVRENMQQLLQVIERYVRAHPEQWVAAFDSIWHNLGQNSGLASEPAGV